MEDPSEANGSDRRDLRRNLARAGARAFGEPVVWVLALAGIFDVMSGDPVVHGTLLFAVAAALVLDAHRNRRFEGHELVSDATGSVALEEASWSTRVAAHVRLSPAAVVVGLVYVVVAGGFARYSWPASIAVSAPAALGVAIAWRRPLRRKDEQQTVDRAGALVWAEAFIALGLWELTNLLLQPSLTQGSQAHPTISVLMDPVLASHAGRSIFLAGWLAFGLFLAER